MRKVLAPIILVVVGLIGAVALVRSKTPVETARPILADPLVRVVKVRTEAIPLTVAAQGTVLPRTEALLAAQVAATVSSVSPHFEVGDFFEKGDVLVRLDGRDYELAVERSAALVAQAELRLVRQQAEARVAADEWSQLGQGEPDPLVLRQPQLAEARAMLRAAQAEHDIARLALERTLIRAPFPGRVHSRAVDVGQYLVPGQPVATIHAIDYADIRLPIPDRDLAYLDLPMTFGDRDGNRPRAVVSALFGGRHQSWEGEVVRTEGELDRKSRMLHLVVRVEDPYSRRRPSSPPLAVGLFVDTEITGNTVTGVLLPRSALRDDQRILVVDQEERLWSREVDIIRIEKERVIVGKGLEDGESVCISPLDVIVDGMHVRTVEATGLTEIGEAPAEAPGTPVTASIEKSLESRLESRASEHQGTITETAVELESTSAIKHGTETSGKSGRLLAMTISNRGENTSLEVSVEGDFKYQTSRLTDPERFVIDLMGVVKANPRSRIPVGDGLVERVRVGQYQTVPKPISRLVFDLSRAESPAIEQDDSGLIVRF